ncbi:hypothetical protein SVI_1875 [Shewanella violacea DSS12]|uniref:Uncharacterized protein n=1 Tax=Shewanella violacea (strain JCM 10179 / CIP 106290 / LMG 19151 / DSS12) TaxID=637905 RepID=D4ZJJ7_SHEVD|nr:hypothetical protein SVI_1875 [Shewanella violacea DSS12]
MNHVLFVPFLGGSVAILFNRPALALQLLRNAYKTMLEERVAVQTTTKLRSRYWLSIMSDTCHLSQFPAMEKWFETSVM